MHRIRNVRRPTLLLATIAVALSTTCFTACGSSSSSSSVAPAPIFTPLPVLIPGTTLTYAGTFSEAITYASPSPQQPNSVGAYETLDRESIATAAPSAPAPIVVHRDLRYATTHVPTSGIQIQHRAIESYESSVVNDSTQAITLFASDTTTDGVDQTANRKQGNGPYKYQSTVTTGFAQPRVLFVFPLVVGSTAVPLARTVGTVERSANAGGVVYSSRNISTHYDSAGAYRENGSIGTGETTRVTTLPNGIGLLQNQGVTTLRITVARPVGGPSQTFFIPVTRVSQGVKKSFRALDWYPGGGEPPSPLATTTQTVKGPASLPSRCVVKVPTSNIQEIDTASTALDVIAATYSMGTTSDFLSNGTVVCRISSSTLSRYDIATGLLVSTTTDSTIEGLTSAVIPSAR